MIAPMILEAENIAVPLRLLLFSASYVIRKENYQISSSLFFFSAIGNLPIRLRTCCDGVTGLSVKSKCLQILHVGSAEHAKIRNESFIMIDTLGEELWHDVPDFWPFFRSSSTLHSCAFGWFFHVRGTNALRITHALKNFSIRFRTGVMFGKNFENAKKNNSS